MWIRKFPAVLLLLIPVGLIPAVAVFGWWPHLAVRHADQPARQPPTSAVNAVRAFERAQARPLMAQDISVSWDYAPSPDARRILCTTDVPTLPTGRPAPCTILRYSSTEVARLKGPVDVQAEVAIIRLARGRWRVVDSVEP